MMSHPAYTLLMAVLLSAGLSMGGRTADERWRTAARMFAGCASAIVVGSWLMRLIHG